MINKLLHPFGILIVEDNVLNQEVLEGYLQRYSMKSTIAMTAYTITAERERWHE